MLMDSIHEECGVFGVFDHNEPDVAGMTYMRAAVSRSTTTA